MTWLDAAKEAIRTSSQASSVYIGCDSIRFKKKKVWYAKYTTVVVIHQDSRHGCQIYYSSETLREYGTDDSKLTSKAERQKKRRESIRMRMLNEVNYAITTATEILDVLEDRHLEIHLDINPDPKHQSNVAVKEALGWVKGTLGIDALIKPQSWAATHAADHAVRHYQ